MPTHFNPILEICRNNPLSPNQPYLCVFTHGECTCGNAIPEARKFEAIGLAAKIQQQPARKICWEDLWKFVTDVHCVHHFDEAVNFELVYSFEILEGMVEKERRVEEWEEELRGGEEREEARRRKGEWRGITGVR
jgi:hypothetical protein